MKAFFNQTIGCGFLVMLILIMTPSTDVFTPFETASVRANEITNDTNNMRHLSAESPEGAQLAEEWQQLNTYIKEAQALAEKKEYGAAKQVLEQLERAFINIDMGQYVNRVEQVDILTNTIIQAKQALTRLEPRTEEINQNLLRLRLTFDAVSHQKQPLWLSFYPMVVQTIEELKDALAQDNRDTFYQKVNTLATQFEIVRPALVISHDVGVVEQLDSEVTFLTSDRSERWQNKDHTLSFLEGMMSHVKEAFFQNKEGGLESLVLVLLLIGSVICSVLSYVAWRKYKGEMEEKKTFQSDGSHDKY
ncbi:sporulation protein YpjB [Caldalkalibacillus salinus]|uniref:sporulation protein YpjB n=1 Tax=Caldalkalibacillus salinus TaxID=2803787 RepID=UPI00192239E3|nr:sporulation protein YpjB [Caldalkalibacillus salinus]